MSEFKLAQESILKQDSAWARIQTLEATRGDKVIAKKQKYFLQHLWDPIFVVWSESPPKEWRELFWDKVYPTALQYGYSSDSFVVVNKPYYSMGSDDVSTPNSKFLARCQFAIARCDDDKKLYLKGSICINDKCYEHEIELTPIIEDIKAEIEEYHAALHTDDDVISGPFGDLYRSASSVAKRVASSKAAKVIYDNARDEALGKIPGGQEAYKLAVKIHDEVAKAREGDSKAKARLAGVAELAREGDPKAVVAVEMAKSINEKLKEKEAASTTTGWDPFKHNPFYQRRKKVAPTPTPKRGVQDHRTVKGPKTGRGSYGIHAPTTEVRESDDEDDGDYEDDISGWFYNRGYRTPSQYLVEIQKSPGVGFSFRELYSLGNGNPPTTKDTILMQASPKVAALYNKAREIGHNHPKAIKLATDAYNKIKDYV